MLDLHVELQGAGIVLGGRVAGKRITAGELRHSLEHVIAESRSREAAGELQKSLRANGSYRQAADEIEAYVAQVK